MFKNYFKTAWRNLWKNKSFSLINIFGLTIGLISFLLISLYIFDELTYDRFHEKADNIFRIVEKETSQDGKESKIAATAYQLSATAKTDIPGIQDIARIGVYGRINVGTTENTNVFYETLSIANAGFLRVFDFKLLQGDREKALTMPNTVVVTEETAKKLFGTVNVLGKNIKSEDWDNKIFKITGVLAEFPSNSHLNFNLLFSEATDQADEEYKEYLNNDWTSHSFITYLLLESKADPNKVGIELDQLALMHRSDDDNKSSFGLQPLRDIHFYSSDIESELGKGGNITYVYIFSLVALFVLFIACINYMNLATARFEGKTKEIAVRKVTGASRKNLFIQFMMEAFLVSTLALVLALAFAKLLLPAFNKFSEKQLSLGTSTDYRIWLGVLFTVLVVSLLSGAYPALFLSRQNPLKLFKHGVNAGKGSVSIRRFLVVFQFSLSIIMIAVTIIVYRQMNYIATVDKGFSQEQLMVVDINSQKVRNNAEMIKRKFANLPRVKNVALSSRVPGDWKNLPKVKVHEEQRNLSDGYDMFFLGIDEGFLQTYQINLLKGRNFSPGSPADSSAILINEVAAQRLGIKSPSEQLINLSAVIVGGNVYPLDDPFQTRVIGIVKDFNIQSLHEPIAPLVLGFQKNPIQPYDYFTVRFSGKNISNTLKQMEGIIQNIDQSHLLEYHFLDKQWELLYHKDHIRANIFFTTAILAILVACLGLIGLSTYEAQQRTKEIGIRKVLGASVSGIVSLLSKDFVRLVLIAIVIATPIAWYAMNKWLQDFAYRIEMHWWMFALAGLLAVIIALLTVSIQSVKAALANPVESLRSE